MKDFTITKAHLDSENNYIGPDLSLVDGNIYSETNLGIVKFKSVKVKFGIYFSAGCGIEAGYGIEAGHGIKAGYGIKAGWGIKAGYGIEAGWGIKAGCGIEAGYGIEAGHGIEAGCGIEAGHGIEAGFSIVCKWISSKLRIFAGTCNWKIPTKLETQIICEELKSGTIAFGELVIKKLTKIETIQVGDLKFNKSEVEAALSKSNGDVVNKDSDLGLDDVVLQVYVARLNSGKPKQICSIFSAERDGHFVPVKKQMVTIPLSCI